jgi:diadenylate cyclase
VIIQGDRVAAAACFLPLSVSARVSRDLGTRHRAALGLTEENDAIAIVVSEETGNISLVLGGGIERGILPDALKVRLRSLLGHRAAPRVEPRRSMA